MRGYWLPWVGVLLGLGLGLPARAAETVVYYHTDALRSVAVVTNAQGQVIERTHYAPYGQVLNRPLREGPGYTGHREDLATGLVYMQQRYYDPESGRFLSTDPVQADDKGGSFNRYWYANDNPYRYTDPDGRYGCSGGKNDCAKIDVFVSKLNDALKDMNRSSNSYKQLSAISSYLGKPGDQNGVTVKVGTLGKNILGQAMKGDKGFIVDVKKFSNLPTAFSAANPNKSISDVQNALGASVVAHEAQHELDHRNMENGYPLGREQARITEENAYGAQSAVGKTLGVRIGYETNEQIQNAVEHSTNAFCEKSTPQC